MRRFSSAAGVKKLCMIVLVASWALLGSTQQGCHRPTSPGCRGAGVCCSDGSQCCGDLDCRPIATTGPFCSGRCRLP